MADIILAPLGIIAGFALAVLLVPAALVYLVGDEL